MLRVNSLSCLILVSLALPACWDWDAFERADSGPRDAAASDTPANDVAIVDARGDADADTLADARADIPVDVALPCGALDGRCCTTGSGTRCDTGLTCDARLRCTPCAADRRWCAGACVDTQRDPSHCSDCDIACPAGNVCSSGACVPPPANDTRAAAAIVDLGVCTVALEVNTSAARNDTLGGCDCTNGRDVFYRLDLAQEEIVYADTVGTTFDTALFFQDVGGNNIPDPRLAAGLVCNNDAGLGCAIGLQSLVIARLEAGTWYLVLSGCGAGAATIHLQHFPVGSGSVTRLVPTPGVTQEFTGTTSGSGRISGECCADGPEDTYWFATCPESVGEMFTATTCGSTAFNTELEQRSATRSPARVCNDDSCGTRSSVSSTIPAGAGLHVMYVDGCGATGSGSYTLGVTFGACSTGAMCDGRCTDLQNDLTHCGTCSTVCPAAGPNATSTCVAGSCALACTPGFGDCNGVAADGCEQTTNTLMSCGGCGVACSTNNCVPACTAGACTLTCNPGFGNCDPLVANGCETNTQSDRTNCGSCGVRCTGSRTCVAGRCS